MITCKNCQHTFEEDFCNRCGQRAETERVSWHYFLHELSQIFFYIEGVLWFTVKELIFRPGILVSNYLNGQRVKYYKPIGLLFVTSGIYLLVKKLLKYTQHQINLTVTSASDKLKPNEEAKSTIGKVFEWLEKYSENVALWQLSIVPLVTLLFYYTFRKKTTYNYWEFAIILLYHSCLMIIVDTLSILLEKIPFINDIYTVVLYCIVWLYFFITVFKRYYTPKQLIGRFLILFLLTILIIVLILVLIVAFSITKDPTTNEIKIQF